MLQGPERRTCARAQEGARLPKTGRERGQTHKTPAEPDRPWGNTGLVQAGSTEEGSRGVGVSRGFGPVSLKPRGGTPKNFKF